MTFGLLIGWLATRAAFAASGEASFAAGADSARSVEGQLQRLEERSSDALRSLSPQGDSVAAFQDALFLQLIGQHGDAASAFFRLLATGALEGTGLEIDAEWYLAEALEGAGAVQSALDRYEAVRATPGHPLRSEATRRLLETYSRLKRVEDFQRVFDQEIASGRVASTDRMILSLGKSYHLQGRDDLAREAFGRIAPGTLVHAKARYWLGALDVAAGRLDEAIPSFQAAAALSVSGPAAQDVVDLSTLALARIAFEQGRLDEAADLYNQVSNDPKHLPDKLHELVWTAIRRAEPRELPPDASNDQRAAELEREVRAFQEAIDGIEVFRLAFEDHELGVGMPLLQGNLQMKIAQLQSAGLRSKAYLDALSAFGTVVHDYEPVRSRFQVLAEGEVSDRREYFRQVLALQEDDRLLFEGGFPEFAIRMIQRDEELDRSLDAFRELEAQQALIAESQQLVEELRVALGEAQNLAYIEALKLDLAGLRNDLLRGQLSVAAGESAELAEAVPSKKPDLERLDQDRQRLQDRLDGVTRQVSEVNVRLQSYEEEVRGLSRQADEVRATMATLTDEIRALRAAVETSGSLRTGEAEIARELGVLQAELASDRERLLALEVELTRLAQPGAAPTLVVDGDLRTQVAQLLTSYQALRPGGSGWSVTADATASLLAGLHQRLDALEQSLSNDSGQDLLRIKQQFETEAAEVLSQSALADSTSARAEGVAFDLARAGFGRLEDLFEETILQAEIGNIDVSWARKLDLADELVRVKTERAALLENLEQRFELIRQKVGP